MDLKISQLNAAGAITGAEMVELVQGGLSVRSTVTNITISASYAGTASVALNASAPTSVPSASWVSASAHITTADTASYVKSSSIDGVLSIWQAPSASVATSASYALSASYAPFTQTTQVTVASASWVSASATINTASYAGTASFLTQNRTYNVTSSWSNNSTTASLLGGVPNSFFNKSNWTIPAFVTTNSQSMVVNTDLLIYINNLPYSFSSGSSVTMPSIMLAGNDYGIYATTASGLIATYANTSSVAFGGYTSPSPYDSTNSRLVGGFYFAHTGSTPLSVISRSRSPGGATASASLSMSIANTGLVTGDYIDVILMTDLTYNTINVQVTASGATLTFQDSGSTEAYTVDTTGKVYKINNSGSINQYSIWDLKFRPNCSDPRGMILVDNSFWVDIWMTGRNYINVGTSRKGERIADGENASSYPLVSTFMGGTGTNTYGECTWFVANEVVSHWGKKLLSYTDFCIAAFNGTTENGSYGTDNQYTCRPNGAQWLSKWGMEQSYGIMFIWGSDLNLYYPATSTSTLVTVNAISRSKTSGIAAVTSSTAHNLQVGDVITTTLFGSGSVAVGTYNRLATTILSVPSTSSFTFNASGSDEANTVDTTGRISTGLSVATVSLPAYSYQTVTSGRGSIYGPSNGIIAGLYGGIWNDGTNAGSRNSIWNLYVWFNNFIIGLRGRCDHLVVP